MRGATDSGIVPPKSSAVPLTSDRQIGAVLLDALLHILVHASRQTIERDEAADGEGDAKRRENGPRRPTLEIAERELNMVQLADLMCPHGGLLEHLAILDLNSPRAAIGVTASCVTRTSVTPRA